jgi:uncharacterized membrane protein
MKDPIKVDVPVNSIERMLNAAALLLAGGALLLAFYHYTSLPDQIPSHFNYKGEVDRYGSKYLLFLLPGIAIVTALGIIYLSGFPHKFNYPKKITTENAAYEYQRARFVIRVLNVCASLLFFVLTWEIIQTSGSEASTMNGLTYMALAALLLAPLAVYWTWPKQERV